MGIRAMIVYFYFVLIDLINDYKKSWNCLYNGFYENCLYNGFSYELLVCRGFSYELLVCGGFFMHIVSFRIIFSMKRGYAYVWGTFKNVRVLRACFLTLL